jgi:hypothetical protein
VTSGDAAQLTWCKKCCQDDDDMFVRMLGERAVIGSKPDDPERLQAVLEEGISS